jgi:hypothetical protein
VSPDLFTSLGGLLSILLALRERYHWFEFACDYCGAFRPLNEVGSSKGSDWICQPCANKALANGTIRWNGAPPA